MRMIPSIPSCCRRCCPNKHGDAGDIGRGLRFIKTLVVRLFLKDGPGCFRVGAR
jgi:hypothetical protein